MITLLCQTSSKEYKLKFFVVDDDLTPILGAKACLDFQIINLQVNQINPISQQGTTLNYIKTEYKDVFEGLGQIGDPFDITLK